MEMPKYRDATNYSKINKQIESLDKPQSASELLATIAGLCAEADTAGSTEAGVNRWLGLFKQAGVRAGKVGGTANLIELYPSGTHGRGRSDRMLLEVTATTVAVIEAGEGSH